VCLSAVVASPAGEVVLETLKRFQEDVMGRLDSMERVIKENTTRLQLLYDIVGVKDNNRPSLKSCVHFYSCMI